MAIKNNQIEVEAKRQAVSPTPPAVAAGEGSWYTKDVGGVAEGFYVDDQGREIQLTEGGLPKGPPNMGEINTASNKGSTGEGWFDSKVGDDLQFKRVVAGTNISLNPQSDYVEINAQFPPAAGEVNTGTNLGLTGEGVFKQKTGTTLEFRRIKAGANVTVTTTGNDEIEIATGAGVGEPNTASNSTASTEIGLFKGKVGVDLVFKRLKGGTGIDVIDGTDEVTIQQSAGAGESNTASNSTAGTGSGLIFARKDVYDLEFRTIKAGSGITVTTNGDDVEIAATGGGGGEANDGANLTGDEGIYAGKVSETLQFKSLSAGTGITLSSDGDAVTITNSGGLGESNDGLNATSGTGLGEVYKNKDGTNIVFRKIKAGNGMAIQTQTDDVLISPNPSNSGTGVGVWDSDLTFRSIKAGDASMTVTLNGSDIELRSVGGGGGGGETVKVSADDTTAGYIEDKISVAGGLALSTTNPAGNEVRRITTSPSNLGTGVAVWSGTDLDFRSFVGIGDIDVTLNGNNIEIEYTGTGGGGGETVKVSANDTTAGYLEDKVVGSGGISISTLNDGANEDLQVAASASNVGTGTGVWSGTDLAFRSIKAGDASVNVSLNGSDIEITATGGGGGSVTVGEISIPAGGSLAAQLAGATGIPGGWTLVDGTDPSVDPNFAGATANDLVIIHGQSKMGVVNFTWSFGGLYWLDYVTGFTAGDILQNTSFNQIIVKNYFGKTSSGQASRLLVRFF